MGGSAGAGGVEDGVLLILAGDLPEVVPKVAAEVTEVDEVELGGDFASKVVAGDLVRGRASLLVDPLDDGVLGAATLVVLSLAISEIDTSGSERDFE